MAETSNIRNLDALLAERRARGAVVRALGPSRRDDAGAVGFGRPFLSPFGWLIAVFINIALMILIALSVVLVPPALACREQSAQGFFAGNDFQTCARRGISVRFEELDGRVRKLILRSGQ